MLRPVHTIRCLLAGFSSRVSRNCQSCSEPRRWYGKPSCFTLPAGTVTRFINICIYYRLISCTMAEEEAKNYSSVSFMKTYLKNMGLQPQILHFITSHEDTLPILPSTDRTSAPTTCWKLTNLHSYFSFTKLAKDGNQATNLLPSSLSGTTQVSS